MASNLQSDELHVNIILKDIIIHYLARPHCCTLPFSYYNFLSFIVITIIKEEKDGGEKTGCK